MQDNQIIYDLVKETRDDVKAINAKLNAHILATASKIEEVKAPQVFLNNIKVVVLWLGAVGGFITPIVLFFSTAKH